MIEWIESLPPWVWIALVVHGVVLGTVAYLILLERKVASWVQDRLGPNRVGPGGLLQPLADGLKFVLKEDYSAKGVDPKLFSIAPALMIAVVIVSIAVIPWGGIHQRTQIFDVSTAQNEDAARAVALEKVPGNAEMVEVRIEQTAPTFRDENTIATPAKAVAHVTYRYPFQIARLNIGVLFILAALSMAVYGVVIGGWASNNKYSFLGGLRATANMISYEIPLGLAIITIILLFGTLDLGYIVDKQAHYWAGFIPAWNVFAHPLAFVMFLICIHAEANRAPFDTAEAEQELVGGYHTEYSSMRFALFFLAEYAGMITTSAVCVALFFGGWHLPWIEWAWPAIAGNVDQGDPSITTSLLACIVRAMVFFGKTIAIIFVFMWVRWSLPRFRFDQIMQLAWRALIPISLLMVVVTALAMYVLGTQGYDANGRLTGKLALALLGTNIVMTLLVMIASTLLPAAADTNRRLRVAQSRYDQTPLPAGT